MSELIGRLRQLADWSSSPLDCSEAMVEAVGLIESLQSQLAELNKKNEANREWLRKQIERAERDAAVLEALTSEGIWEVMWDSFKKEDAPFIPSGKSLTAAMHAALQHAQEQVGGEGG